MALLSCGITMNAHDFEVDGIYYKILSEMDLTVLVTYKGYETFEYSNEYAGKVVIPESVTYDGNTYTTAGIGDFAFFDCSGLTGVSIPYSVTGIGGFAFDGCSRLTSITIPNSVMSIMNGAFSHCSNLMDITIPNSVMSIMSGAFQGCSKLTSVTIPNSVTSLESSVFQGCSKLTSVTIPNSVTSIESSVFQGCSRLTSITIPSSVTSIGYSAFQDCSGLMSITIPNSVTNIGEEAFSGCSSLTSITIPNSVTNIGFYAFNGCINLANLTIKNPTSISIAEMPNFSSSATLTVPNGSAKAYNDIGGFWGQFASIKEEANVNISEENMWSTCVLAFDAELPEGVRAFISTGMDENSVLMEEVTTLEAYKPYVLYAQNGYEGTLSGVVDLTTYQETVTDGVLSGAIVKQETSSGYILQNQGQGSKFYNVNGQTFTIPAGKCWLSAFDASGISVTMRFTGGVTGIEGVYVNSPADIEADETVYDLEGRRVENPQPGRVYIKGGKKVMLKN